MSACSRDNGSVRFFRSKQYASPRIRLKSDLVSGIAILLAVSMVTLVPVVYVVVDSFNINGMGQAFKFGLNGWQEALSNVKTLSSIGYSFLLAIRIPIALVIAVVIAWLLIRLQIPGARFIEHALWFSFFLPLLPLTMGWVLLLDAHYGLLNTAARYLPFVHGAIFSINSVAGIIWVHLSLSTVPVMVILLAPALRRLDAAQEEASAMSGAGTLMTLWRITVPLIAPAILTALIAGFIRSLELFEVEQYLGTPVGIMVYATRIYDLITTDPPLYPQAMALSTFFLAVLLIFALLYQKSFARLGSRATIAGKATSLRSRRRGRWSYVISACLFLYLAVTVGMPLTVLILGSLNRLFGFFFIAHPWTFAHWRNVLGDPAVIQAALNSSWIGLASGIIGTLLYALLAWVLVRSRIWARSAIAALVWLPWGIPGLVLGLSLSSIMLNTPVVSVLYGSSIPLIVAMIIKSMPIGVHMLRTSIGQISSEIEEAAQIAGADFTMIFRRITLPLISPMCLAIFLLVFMATMSDISTVVLLASPGSPTLALLMFQYMTSSHPEAAAVVGVIIASLSLFITALAFRIAMIMNVEP